MTTTLTPGTLVVTINEQVTLNGQEANSVNTLTLTNNIAETYKRILTVPTSEIVAWTTHDTDVAGSQFDDDLVKYARITNKDGDNNIIVRIKNADNDEFAYKLGPAESFLLHAHESSMIAVAAATLDIGAGWHDITSVKLTAPDGACDAEIFVACI